MAKSGVSPFPSPHGLDDIARPNEEFSETKRAELEAVVWRKIDIWVLPLLTCYFLLGAIDRTNIGNARIAGLQKSLHISNYQYTLALTATYIPYILTGFPYTLLLKYVGPDIMLPGMVAIWGVVAATQGLARNYSDLLVCRFFLGMVEGGLFPGIILYLSFFYPRKRLQTRVAAFYASESLSGAFSGLLAAAIDQMKGKGGRPGWAWIFILEGLFTFVFGVVSFFLLPGSPGKARFLTERERVYVISALKNAGSMSKHDEEDRFSWAEVIKSAKSPHVWFLATIFYFNGAIMLGLAYFEPTIVAGLGYTGDYAQLMSVPPFAVTFVLSMTAAFVSDRYQCRGYTLIFFSLLQTIGFSMFHASTSKHVRYASLFFSVCGAFGAGPPRLAWLANNSVPHARRATAVGVACTMTELGGLLSTWLLGAISHAPDYKAATITFIAMSTGMVVVSTANLIYLSRENRLKAERRQGMRKEDEPDGLGDRSAWFLYSL